MISAFGVEHTVSKSYLGGGVFKPAKALDLVERTQVVGHGKYAAAHGMTSADRAWKDTRKAQVEAVHSILSHGTKENPSMIPGSAGTYRVGGKSSGQSYVVSNLPKEIPKKLRRQTMGHEAMHALPKRSSYRLHNQIMSDPKKLFREEGRADYLSGGHYSKHPDSGSVYAQGARAIDQMNRKGPDVPFKLQKKTTKQMKKQGLAVPRIPNRTAVTNVEQGLQRIMPHYPLQGRQGDQALNSYRGLHDKMRRAGTKGGLAT